MGLAFGLHDTCLLALSAPHIAQKFFWIYRIVTSDRTKFIENYNLIVVFLDQSVVSNQLISKVKLSKRSIKQSPILRSTLSHSFFENRTLQIYMGPT